MLPILMDAELCGHLFGFSFQFKTWYKLILGKEEERLKEKDMVEGEEVRCQRTTA